MFLGLAVSEILNSQCINYNRYPYLVSGELDHPLSSQHYLQLVRYLAMLVNFEISKQVKLQSDRMIMRSKYYIRFDLKKDESNK